MCLTIFCMFLGYAQLILMKLCKIMHTCTCPHRSASLHYRLGPRTCHSWSQCWCCRGYVYHHLPDVLLHWSRAGCTYHLLPCERKREEQWTAKPYSLRRHPAYTSVWWGGSRQAGGERECCIWSSGQTGDETESFIWSCETLVSLDCCIDSVNQVHEYFSQQE